MAEVDTLPVDVSVNINLHPLTLKPEGEALGEDNHLFTTARDALKNAYEICSMMSTAHKAAFSENEARNIQMIEVSRRTGTAVPGSYMGKDGKVTIPLDTNLATNLNDSIATAFNDNLAPRLDAALKAVTSKIAEEETKISSGIRDPRGTSAESIEYARDVRAHVKAMATPGERATFLKQAIESGNVKAASAILNTDGFLSGIPDAVMSTMRSMAEHKFTPAETKTVEALRALEKKIVAAGSAALGHRQQMMVPVREKQTLTLTALNRLRANGKAGK